MSSKDGGSSMDFDSFASTAGTAKNTYTETVKFKARLQTKQRTVHVVFELGRSYLRQSHAGCPACLPL